MDLKVGNGRIGDKAALELATGVPADIVRPFSKTCSVSKHVATAGRFLGERTIKALPLAGALWTLFGPGEASAGERVARAVAGEIGIGPVDAELVFFDLLPHVVKVQAEYMSTVPVEQRYLYTPSW